MTLAATGASRTRRATRGILINTVHSLIRDEAQDRGGLEKILEELSDSSSFEMFGLAIDGEELNAGWEVTVHGQILGNLLMQVIEKGASTFG